MTERNAGRSGHEPAPSPELRLLPDPAAPQPTPAPAGYTGGAGLPAPLTSFIGREPEIAAIVGLLRRGNTRLLTLTGPGGVGKTRLALRVGEEAAAAFADGAVFVSLATITDPNFVLPTVARALGLREDATQPISAVLAEFLRPRRLLLIIDNFEQVRSAAANLAALLAACPDLVILVTSRAPLHIAGEQCVPVAPLALPDPVAVDARPAPSSMSAQIAASPAVQLFVDRARAVDPGFVLDETNAAPVAAVCRRLDGLPLAIELAAARTHLLAPSELLAHLHPALLILDGGPDDAPDRLRTMRDAIAWSYELLPAEEQRLFRRLGVFVGGFTLEAAEWVADASQESGVRSQESSVGATLASPAAPASGYPNPQPATLDLVASLVDTSLLRRAAMQGVSRFTMLETIREFALERLEANGEAEAARREHVLLYVRLTEDARARIHGPEGANVLDRLEAEHGNLRAALFWTIAAGETELALRLSYAAWRLWWMRSHLEEGRTWLERALALPDNGPTTAVLRPKTQIAAGYFARVQGDYARAAELGKEALALAEQFRDAHDASGALHLLSMTATDRGELAEAQSLLETGIAIDRSVDYEHGVAFGLSDLGDVALAQGRLADAAALADEAMAIWRARGDAWSVAWALIGCGRIARAQGDQTRALSLVAEALTGSAKLGDKEIAARGSSELAAIAAERGDLRLAARLYGAVAALREAIGAPLAPTERAVQEAAVAGIRAGLASGAFAAAWEEGRALSLDQIVAEVATLDGEANATVGNRASVPDLLTPREREVLRHLVQGWSDKEIAAALGIGRRTVSTHVAAVRNKLGASSRSAAAAIAARDRLI